ncbi:MAG: hypothetical protein V5A47_01850 [Bacteroidales bacterium]
MMRTVLFLVGVLLVLSCEREPGPGGKSSIEGTLMVKEYNKDFSVLLDERPAQSKDIYINFGDADVIGDDMETNFNGKFKFPFLQPGNYTLWYFSDDTIPNSNSEMVMEQNIKLDNKEKKKLGKIFTYDTKEFDEGSGTICGKVYLINYKNSATPPYEEDSDIKDITPAQDEEVYLIYNENETFNEDVETNYDGKFCFTDLIKGKYRIFVYSEDLPGGVNYNADNVIVNEDSDGTYDLAVYQDVEITEKGKKIQLEDFYIEQE